MVKMRYPITYLNIAKRIKKGGAIMENVYDLVQYKKRKKKLILVKKLNQHKFTLTFLLLFSLSSLVWWLVSFKAALLLTIATLLVPFIINGRMKKKKIRQKKSMEQFRSKPAMRASLFKK
jgi:hypothetical protein